MNFRYRFMQFMMGRYGTDLLNTLLLGVSICLSFINLFFRSLIIQLLVYGIVFYAIFRMFSRNIVARRRENAFFISKFNFIKKRKEFYDRCRADKFHVYKKCPECKSILKLPHRIGKHSTVCPKCGKEFKVYVRK